MIAKPKLANLADCVLALEGAPGGVTFLYPDGPPGRYRIAGPMLRGGRAVIDVKPDGVHFWASILHLRRR